MVSGTEVLDDVVLELDVLDDVGPVVDEVVVTVVSGEVEELVVAAVVEVVVDASVVGGASVVVSGASVVVEAELDDVTVVSCSEVVVVESSGEAGAMLPRPSRSSSTMPGRLIDVGDSGVVTGTVLPPIWAAGSRSASTLTAFNANGAATAAAVTVDSDRASQNRPRPVDSPGRCRYMKTNPN